LGVEAIMKYVQGSVVGAIRQRLNEAHVIALQLCGRFGSGKTSLVEHLASSLHHLEGVGILSPALPEASAPVATAEEVGVWYAPGVSHFTPEIFLHLLDELPLHSLDYLFLEENRDPSCTPPMILGCHARGLLLPVTGGLHQIDQASEAILRSHFILLTHGDRRGEVAFDVDAARTIIRQINDAIPVFLLSHAEHSEWMGWLAYLEGLRREHHQIKVVEEPCPELYFG
jgi:Ni2+-binding GTPase involved in maturation of urease and hydrogenase